MRTGTVLTLAGAVALAVAAVLLWRQAPAPNVYAAADEATPQPPSEAPAAPVLRTDGARTQREDEQRFKRTDRDDDGAISRDEFLHNRRRAFDRLDVNGDGVLSFEEDAAATIRRFEKAETGGDGSLSPAEYLTTAPKRRAKAEPPPAVMACSPTPQACADLILQQSPGGNDRASDQGN